MKRILNILALLLFMPLVSCSNQPNSSQNQSGISDKSGYDDVFPTLNQLYPRNGNSALVSANIDQIYTNVYNVSGEKFMVLKLSIEKDIFNCTEENVVCLPINVEYLSLTTKIDLTSEIEKIFLDNTNLYVYLSNINYGNRSSDYRNKDNNLNFENLFVTNSINLVNYYSLFLMKNSVLVKDDIPNLLIENNIISEKRVNPFYDDTFYEGMTKDEIEKIFSKIDAI